MAAGLGCPRVCITSIRLAILYKQSCASGLLSSLNPMPLISMRYWLVWLVASVLLYTSRSSVTTNYSYTGYTSKFGGLGAVFARWSTVFTGRVTRLSPSGFDSRPGGVVKAVELFPFLPLPFPLMPLPGATASSATFNKDGAATERR